MPGIECVGQVESKCPKRLLSNSRGQAGSAFYKSTSALWSSCLSNKEVKASFWFLLILDFCVTKMTLPHCVSSQLLGLPEKWEQCFHGMHAKLLQYLTDGVLPPVWRQFLPRNSVYQLLWSLHQSYNHGRLPLCFKGPCCDDRTGVIQAPQRSFISQTQSDGVIGALPTVHMEARSLRVLRWACGQDAWSYPRPKAPILCTKDMMLNSQWCPYSSTTFYMPGSTCTASDCWQCWPKWWPMRSEAFRYLKVGEQPQC